MASLLLDTHVVLWSMANSNKLSKKAYLSIRNGKNHVSVATYWELAIKINIGKLDLGGNWRTRIDELLHINNISLLSIDRSHCDLLSNLPIHHRDPFDRMLIAQAQYENLALVTADKHIHQYDIEVIW